MKRILLVAVVTALSSCRHPGQAVAEPGPDAGRPLVESPMEGMDDVMQAKLVHSGSLLEAIALEDFEQIGHHADALTWLSERSDWKVHTTEAYAVFSDRFRDVTRAVSRDAAARDIDAVAASYVSMTESCVACHAYLRREGLIRPLPGAVARLGPDAGTFESPG